MQRKRLPQINRRRFLGASATAIGGLPFVGRAAAEPQPSSTQRAGAASRSTTLEDHMLKHGNPLATPDQVAMEDLAMRLYRSNPVKDAMDRWRKLYKADPRASTASGKRTVDQDLNELSFQACYIAAIDTPDDPK